MKYLNLQITKMELKHIFEYTFELSEHKISYPYAAANKSLGFGALFSSLKTSNQYASSIASEIQIRYPSYQ